MDKVADGFVGLKLTARLYIIVLSIALTGILFSLYAGRDLARPIAPPQMVVAKEPAQHANASHPPPSSMMSAVEHNASSGLSRLVLQLAVIITVSSAVGLAFARLGQPS